MDGVCGHYTRTSQVLQVLLDVPQSVGALPELPHLTVSQGHVDHAGHAAGVQDAGQAEIHLAADPVQALNTHTAINSRSLSSLNSSIQSEPRIQQHCGVTYRSL